MTDEKTPYQLRKERSAAMASAGITPAHDAEGVYWIPSQTVAGRRYKVVMQQNGWCDCSCPDNGEGHLCKHIILLKFYLRAREQAHEEKRSVTVTTPCPECGSSEIQKDGTRKTTLGRKQKWLCNACNKRFVVEPIKNIKGNMEAVVLCMDLYFKGVSYRGIKDSIQQFYGLRITHITVMRWIRAYMERINSYVEELHPTVGDTWHADEQLVKIKGNLQYVWNCMDGETRFLLANSVTPSRTTENARSLFQQAKQQAGTTAKTVITDGAFAYGKAVRKEFATYANPKPHYRYVSIRAHDSNNNKIERYHGSFRQRDKTMRSFKSPTGTAAYAQGFKNYYNFMRPHLTLGSTPAQKAGLPVEANWHKLLTASLQKQPQGNSRGVTATD